jgi:glycosyltransferase involved in cell wall biosynthesis
MRIAMLAQFYPPIIGGEERHVRNLAQALAGRGHDVSVVTLANKDTPSEELDGPVRVFRVRGLMERAGMLFSDGGRRHAPPFPDPEVSLHLHRLFKTLKPDIVHAHNWIVHSFLPVKRLTSAKLILTLHDYSQICAKKSMMQGDDVCSGPGLRKCLSCAGTHYGRVMGTVTSAGNWVSSLAERRLVDRFLTVSRAVADGNALAQHGVPFEVIPNFIPGTLATENAGSAAPAELLQALPNEPFALFVGDLRRMKGLHATLEAYGKLRNAPPLVLIGRECPDTPSQLPPNVFKFVSWPHAAIMAAWQRSMFGLAPSVWPDPCPTVVMEGMVSGKPMIGTRMGGIPDMIDDGVNGLLVLPNDANALAVAMQALIDKPELRERMAAANLSKIKSFVAASVVPRIESVYSDVLTKSAAGLSLVSSTPYPISRNSASESPNL